MNRKDDYRYLHTFEGEKYLAPQTLDELETVLPVTQFFRANRKVILSLKARSRYEIMEYRQFQVFNDPLLSKPDCEPTHGKTLAGLDRSMIVQDKSVFSIIY